MNKACFIESENWGQLPKLGTWVAIFNTDNEEGQGKYKRHRTFLLFLIGFFFPIQHSLSCKPLTFSRALNKFFF